MRRYISRLSLTLALWLVSASIAIGGIGFLSAAFYLSVRDISSPTIGALATGAAALFVAGLIAVVAWVRMQRAPVAIASKEKTASAATSPEEMAAELGQLLGLQVTSWVRCHGKSATALALVAGLVVGASPELRGALREMFKRPS